MVRLSPESERRDALSVLAADRRELVIEIKTEQPLRKPRGPAQKLAMERLRASVAEQIDEQLSESSRKVFRGQVAVELTLATPAGRHAAALPRIVKDYIDMLRGPVVPDDAVIEHLMVLRTPAAGSDCVAIVRCLPLSIFCMEFDRAFRVTPELGGAHVRPVADMPHWGLDPLEEHALRALADEERLLDLIEDLDAEEEEQLAEDPDAEVDLDVPSGMREFAEAQVRDSARVHLEERTALTRGRWLADQAFDVRDRPGPLAAWLDETARQGTADIALSADSGPGCFVLPAPTNTPTADGCESWDKRIEREFVLQRPKGRRWWSARFPGPVVLDIAVRGGAAPSKDLDNLAHTVVRAFGPAFVRADLDLVGYRVYRKDAATSDVRVRVMSFSRLVALSATMAEAREHVRSSRAERARPLE